MHARPSRTMYTHRHAHYTQIDIREGLGHQDTPTTTQVVGEEGGKGGL